MSVNLLHNAKKALTGHPLHLIQGKGCYKYFVKNRAGKIREKKEILNSTGNPAVIGSRGMSVAKMGQLRCKGPGWFRDSDKWPSDIKAKETVEKEKEAIIIKDMTTSTALKSGVTDEILQRFIYWKFLRITS